MHRNRIYTVLPVIGSLAFADIAAARIKLITLPARERVEVRLEHQNATLMEEERIVSLVRGADQVDNSKSTSTPCLQGCRRCMTTCAC